MKMYYHGNQKGVVRHEFGHALYNLILSEELPNDVDGILERAKNHAFDSGKLESMSKSLWDEYMEGSAKARKIFDENVKNQGFADIESYRQSFKPDAEAKINSMNDKELISR